MKPLPRRELRYWCFRFKQAADGGASAKGAPRGLRRHIEANEYFGGWESFGVTWDWDDPPERIVPLRHSLESEWNAQAWASAKPLPVGEVP